MALGAAGRAEQHRLPAQRLVVETSKNILNSPLYDALKVGVTAISPSRVTVSSTCAGPLGREAGEQVVHQVVRVVAHLDHLDPRGDPAAGQLVPAAAGSWSASSRDDDGVVSPADHGDQRSVIPSAPRSSPGRRRSGGLQ